MVVQGKRVRTEGGLIIARPNLTEPNLTIVSGAMFSNPLQEAGITWFHELFFSGGSSFPYFEVLLFVLTSQCPKKEEKQIDLASLFKLSY